MKINGEELKTLAVFPTMMTVPDCLVVSSNKLGGGHGEAKFYIASKEDMYSFYGQAGFEVKCFLLKKDLLSYMVAIKNEYFTPSLDYQKKDQLPQLWQDRMDMIDKLDDVIFFTIKDQNQIGGPRGYINSADDAYQIIRTLALPLVSYIYVEKVGTESAPLFYWKLFVDFTAVNEIQNGPLVFKYGKKKDAEKPAVTKEDKKAEKKRETISRAREGQGKYREALLEQCRFCPFTMIADERLLIASHIKPWAAADDDEKIDPYNGYMLSPLYDKLFDRGFITFTHDKHVVLSKFISPFTWKQIKLADNDFIRMLPMDDKRYEYLKFHHENVFKGTFDFKD
ncbi:HNH endonuclease [Selenomonas ruminantium]|uniref:HNH endonuclease n=1 Tax=Selenomonas ruminantium TaxID=971 RepID=UPI0026EBA26C|nr:HNH endonuclease [Selenomonas ruminantium]